MVFNWSMRDKTPQVSSTPHSILDDLRDAVVWIISTRLLISKSYFPFTKSFVIVTRATITIGITVTFMFHNFFQYPIKVEVLILFFAYIQFYSVVSRDIEVDNSFLY